MSTISKSYTSPAVRHDKTLRVVAVGIVALLLLAAATDRRNAILDATASRSEQVDQVVPPPTHAAMVRDMLTHD